MSNFGAWEDFPGMPIPTPIQQEFIARAITSETAQMLGKGIVMAAVGFLTLKTGVEDLHQLFSIEPGAENGTTEVAEYTPLLATIAYKIGSRRQSNVH